MLARARLGKVMAVAAGKFGSPSLELLKLQIQIAKTGHRHSSHPPLTFSQECVEMDLMSTWLCAALP